MAVPPAIGLLSDVFDGPFQSPLIEAAHQLLKAAGRRLIYVQATPSDITRLQIASDLVDGWLVINMSERIEQLAALGKPVVLLSGHHSAVSSVVPDNVSGATEVMQHLLSQGHTRVAFIGYMRNQDFRDRHEVYRAELESRGLYDPSLVLDPGGYDILQCYHVFQSLLMRDQSVTAVFGANDWAAMGALQAFREVGKLAPRDVSVVGFDDIVAAQHYQPPLSSVRQRPDEIGRVGAALLLEKIAGRAQGAGVTYVPTKLVIRESSRAAIAGATRTHAPEHYQGADWRELLAHDLVETALDPIPLADGARPEDHWPSIGTILDGLAAIAEGQPHQNLSALVWKEGMDLAGSAAALEPTIDLLRTAGFQRLAHRDTAIVERFVSWIATIHRTISADSTLQLANQFERQRMASIAEYSLLEYFNQEGADPRQLGWVGQTWIDWAVLGLWDDQAGSTGPELQITSRYQRGEGTMGMGRAAAPASFPPLDLAPPEMIANFDYILKISPLKTASRQWGYLATYERIYATGYDTIQSRNTYIATALERQGLINSLTDRQATLQSAYERERAMTDIIRDLGCPLIPLLPSVLLIPLIGVIDEQRAALIIEQVLAGVAQERATHVLLDITGVPLVDTHVAAALIQTARAVRMLGARVTLVGVRPEIAQSIISLHVDLGDFETQPTLAVAVQRLIRDRSRQGGAPVSR
jgi:DNA-binding LacI/PurR family transcriptional regulator/anti-anti-sigma regulatory factor